LPVKDGQRRKKLESLKDGKNTVIFYESPHRLLKSLRDMEKILGDRLIFVARELTKKFEEGIEGSAATLIKHFTEKGVRGEFVVILRGES